MSKAKGGIFPPFLSESFKEKIDRSILYRKEGMVELQGWIVTKPKVLTGVEDNINAGYCLGLLSEFNITQCMLLGMAASGSSVTKIFTYMFTDKTNTEVATTEDICCPFFDQSKWDNVQHEWNNKLFLKDSVPEVFHIPLPGTYKKVITKMWSKAKDAGADPELNDFFILTYDPSAFKGELYMSITREVPGGENVKLSGKFLSKVFEGYYNEVARCIQEMNEYLSAKKLVSKKDYIYFPYCPKCAKKYGHNYIVVFSEIEMD